jgi:glycosyltransferase involved in cell wall biosynthesis
MVGWMSKGQVYAAAAAVAARLPSVWSQAGIASRRAPIDLLAAALPAELVVTPSRGADAEQRKLTPRRPTRVIYPAVDTARFDPGLVGPQSAVRRRLGLPEGVPIFGSVGRLDRWKGFHVLLEAVPRVVERHPDAHFVLVGGPHEFDPGYAVELHEQAGRMGVDGRVLLVGQQANPHEWMQAMDVFVHASQNEPFGMVVIEAMALGKPVVASAEGGPTEVITPGVDGLLAPFGDHRAFADAISRYLGDAGLRARVGRAAALRAQDFTVQRFARELGAVLAEVVGHGRA